MNAWQVEEKVGMRAVTKPTFPVAPESAEAVLHDMLFLLEEYGPSWFPLELRDRALAALDGAARAQRLTRVGA